MTKRKKQYNLVINLLEKRNRELESEITLEQGNDKVKIELKEQIKDSLAILKLCENHNIFASEISLIEIPDGGSEAHFTEFRLVDESETKGILKNAIKKDDKGEIILNCKDLIIKR